MQYTRPVLCGSVFLFIVFSTLSLRAQFAVGIEGGYNVNYLTTNNANRAFTNYVHRSGFGVGVPVTYQVNEWLSLVAVPSYIQKNYRQERSGFFQGIYQNNRNSYIQLPLTARASFGGDRLKGFVDAGAFAGYWLSGNVEGVNANVLDDPGVATITNIFDIQKAYSYNEPYTFDKKKDNRFEAGLVGGLGLSYDITTRYRVFAESKIFYSLTDQQKNYMINQIPRYNTTYGIFIGVMYNLGKLLTEQ